MQYNRRRRLLASCSAYQPIEDKIESAKLLVRTDYINQYTTALATDLYQNDVRCPSIRSKLVAALQVSVTAGAPTVDFAEETSASLDAAARQPCDLDSNSTISSLSLVVRLAGVDTRGDAFSARFGKSLLGAISSSLGASADSICGKIPEYTADQTRAMMNSKLAASNLIMKGLLKQNLVGEAAVKVSTQFTNQLAERSSLQMAISKDGGVQAQRRFQAVPSGAAFNLSGIIPSEIGLSDSTVAIDLFRADDFLMDAAMSKHSGITFMSSFVAGLEISRAGAATSLSVQGLSRPIGITIPIDPDKKSEDSFWKDKVNCAWYSTADGKWSFSGCVLEGVTEAGVLCKCTHLTQFAIALNPDVVICGDGKKTGSEECDDGNTVGSDGCSPLCEVENGAFCDTQEPSICLRPCPAGEYLDGYNVVSAVVTDQGACKPCDPRTYKSAMGFYDSRCTPMTTCPAGKEKRWPLKMKTKSDGSCVPCPKGFYKPFSPNADPLAECTRCPQFSITTSEGSDDERDCRCDNVQRYQNPASATIDCIYADSCSIPPGPCVDGAACTFSDSCGTTCKCPPFHYGNGFTVGTDVFDVFYGALTGTGCEISGNNETLACKDGYFGSGCQYKMPVETSIPPVLADVQDLDSDGVVDGFFINATYNGEEVASLKGQPGFLPFSFVNSTSIVISIFTREDLDSLNPGLAPDPSWLQSNLLATDPRYVCAPTGTPLSAEFILKLKPAGQNFSKPLQLEMDAAGVPASDPPRYKHVMLFNETANAWKPLGQPTLSDRVSAPLAHFSLYASGAGAQVPTPTTSTTSPGTTPLPPSTTPAPRTPIAQPAPPQDDNVTSIGRDPEISAGVLIAAVGLPLIFLIAALLFIYRYKIFKKKSKAIDDVVIGEVGVMTLPLVEHDPHVDDNLETSRDLPAIEDADSSEPTLPALPAPPEDSAHDLLAASGVKIEEWIACSSCQVLLSSADQLCSCVCLRPLQYVFYTICDLSRNVH